MQMRIFTRAAVLAAAVFPLSLHAQAPAAAPPRAPEPKCTVISDSAAVPTAAQIRDRRRLRAALDSIGRAHGVAAPAGILFVDVDAAHQGKVFFIDSNLDQPATDAATRRVAAYLSSLEAGRPYQALVRLDADYAAPAPGKRSCAPLLVNEDTLQDLMQRVAEHHPEAGAHQDSALYKHATVRLVVNREGRVSYAEVVQPTGDAYLDPYLEDISSRLRFIPATLDGVPYDVRFRFSLQFSIH